MSVAPDEDELDSWLRSLPWWRRPRKLRRNLSAMFAFVAFSSVALVAIVNIFAGRALLVDGTNDGLVGVAEARARSIEEGAGRLLARTAAVSSDLAVSTAMAELVEAFEALGERLDTQQDAELDRFYRERVLAPLEELEVDVSLADVSPSSPKARYLQYHYTLSDPDLRAEVADAGDGSAYSDVHARWHPYLRQLAERLGTSDLKLVSAKGDIVYTVEKRIDLGTSLVSGPYRESTLASTLTTTLPRVGAGTAVLSDLDLYLPGGAEPVVFSMSDARSGTEVLGALVTEIPGTALDAITTAGGRWEEVGLEAGESYLVGTDQVLRSQSRQWIEDPEGYLSRVDDELLAKRIELLESPVGLQPVDTAAVRTALDGQVFSGRSANYLGQAVFSHARSIDVAGVTWVVVADVPINEARQPLIAYAVRIGVTLAILLPLAALLGALMAARLTRPVPLIVEAADAVARGERDPDLPDFGRNEYGDLTRRLRATASQLGAREDALERQYEQTRSILLAALPPRVVGDERRASSTGEITGMATVISISLDIETENLRAGEALGDLYAWAARTAEQEAARADIERVRAAADRYLFIAGLGEEGVGADAALQFATTYASRVRRFAADNDASVTLRIGLSTGLVEAGLIRSGNLSFTAWGEPVRTAMVIGTAAESARIGVDATTARAATPGRWQFEPARPLTDLDDRPVEVFVLVVTDEDDPPTAAGSDREAQGSGRDGR